MASGNGNLAKLEENQMDFVKKFSKAFNMNNLQKICELVDEGIFHLERNVRAKVVFLDISLQMARLIK